MFDQLQQMLRERLGLGETYISENPRNLGVKYRKFGPVSVMQGFATPESKRQAIPRYEGRDFSQALQMKPRMPFMGEEPQEYEAPLQRPAGSMQQTMNPQYQDSPYSEGSNIQGQQFVDRFNPQQTLQGSRLQPASQGYKIQNANPRLRLK